jgi:hypothetical protein
LNSGEFRPAQLVVGTQNLLRQAVCGGGLAVVIKSDRANGGAESGTVARRAGSPLAVTAGVLRVVVDGQALRTQPRELLTSINPCRDCCFLWTKVFEQDGQ